MVINWNGFEQIEVDRHDNRSDYLPEFSRPGAILYAWENDPAGTIIELWSIESEINGKVVEKDVYYRYTTEAPAAGGEFATLEAALIGITTEQP